MAGRPINFTNGISTVSKIKPLGDFPLPDPFHSSSNDNLGVVHYAHDFLTSTTSDYTVTGTGSTFALTNAVGGAAVLTPGGATTASSAYKTNTFLQFAAGKRAWFASRFMISSVTGPTAYVGLQAGSSTADGLWFAMASGGSFNLVSTVSSTATTLASGVATAANATWIELAFYYNGTDLLVFANGNLVARALSPTLTSALLSPVFQITPTATQTLTVDFVLAAFEMSR